MWLKNFFCDKSHMGTPLQSIFFTHKKFFHGQFPRKFGRTDQKKFQYDQRPSYVLQSDWKILIFVKSLMGTKVESIFFTHNFFFSYCRGLREVSESKFASVRSKIFLYDSLKTREFWWVKTPIGIQWFEVNLSSDFFVFARESWSKLVLAAGYFM